MAMTAFWPLSINGQIAYMDNGQKAVSGHFRLFDIAWGNLVTIYRVNMTQYVVK